MRLCELRCYFSAWGGPSECSFFLTFRLIKKALVNVWTAQEVWSSFHLHKLPVPSFLGLEQFTLWIFSSSFQLLLLQQCNLTDFLGFILFFCLLTGDTGLCMCSPWRFLPCSTRAGTVRLSRLLLLSLTNSQNMKTVKQGAFRNDVLDCFVFLWLSIRKNTKLKPVFNHFLGVCVVKSCFLFPEV